MCTVPENEWPTEDPEVIEAIKTDFMGTWGDRRLLSSLFGSKADIKVVKSVCVPEPAFDLS